MMSMESISSQQPNNGIHRDDDYRKRILQSTCAFYDGHLAVIVQLNRKKESSDKWKMTHVFF